MKSHHCSVGFRDFRQLLLPIFLPLFALSAILHMSAKLSLLPKPRPALDVDRIILYHQADAARSSQDATLVLIGDSSCLMNVSARALSENLHQSALNLASFSYLGLADYTSLILARPRASSSKQTIVLLMHPEALRRLAPDPHYGRMLSDYLKGADHCEMSSFYGSLACIFGLEIVHGRILARVFPQPLHGKYAEAYGFTSGLEKFLTAERGSLIEVESKRFSGNAEYRLASSLQLQSRAFHEALPPGTKLLVGITPIPQTFAPQGYSALHEQMLQQWSEWLQADAALTDLPPVLADNLFSTVTHLNRDGGSIYTDHLTRSLAPHLPAP